MDPRVVANQPVDNTPVPLLSTGPLGTRRSPYALRTLDTPFTGHIWCCLTPPRRQHACRVPHHAPARPVFARGYRRPNVCISALERNHSLRSGNKALRSGPPLPPDLRLASVRCLSHNDSSVGGVTPWSRRYAPLCAWKESTYDHEAPAHDPTPPTHVGRLADPELL